MATSTKKPAAPVAAAVRKAKTKAAAEPASVSVEVTSAQDAPLVFRDSKNNIVLALKVDSAKRVDGLVKVVGWSAGSCVLRLAWDGVDQETHTIRSNRPDVAAALRTAEPPEGFGFLISAPARKGALGLRVLANIDGKAIDKTYGLTVKDERSTQTAAASIQALGIIESAAASAITGSGVLAGWVVHDPDVRVWVETSEGLPFSLADAHRVYRQDVIDVHGSRFAGATWDSGFILRLEDVLPGQTLRLIAQQGDEPVVLAEVGCTSLPADPVAASRWLFGMSTPVSDMYRRLPKVDMPIIQALIEHRQRVHEFLPVTSRQLGAAPTQPAVSVIVPLYGRSDFVEHQLLEFCRDSWFTEHAELIYVLDDPRLVTPFTQQAETLHRLFKLPFKWVWGGANRGFAGANNLGAACATAPNLLFLNSDVFPQAPGWIEQLLEVLATSPRVGAVGPRLVFANGAIQHAGIEFMRREELGIWVNHHPFMGLDPSLDPHQELTCLPAVTGACLAMRRAQFDEVGGWDTGYLVGDFEDSDLCLKLRAAGWDIAYQPAAQLTHLERQSFRLLGEDDYRTRVVIHNAVRHQNRWGSLLAAPFTPTGA